MNTDFRLSVNFFTHPKTLKLKRRIGDTGLMCLLRLWAFTATAKPDGKLRGLDVEDLALAAGWDGEPEHFVNVLVECGWLEHQDGVMAIHDWDEHNAYAAHASERSEKARQAAEGRWNKKYGLQESDSRNGDAKPCLKQCSEHNLALLPASASNAPTPTPTPTPTPAPAPAPVPSSTEQRTGVLEGVEARTANDAPPSADAKAQGNPRPAAPEKPAAKATRLPADFAVPPDWLAWANQAHPLIDARLEAAKFCDYWKAASGKNATKHDWQATWRNWIRNAHPPRAQPGKPPTLTERNSAALQEWIAMKQREFAENSHATH